ncbi:aromatic ring-opening dioxygenase LigA [Streptomyces sp. SID2888]|uniref:aromatic ring-opening dioxygenase LigA n=1 Tax=Streptomyces sp. SID2888 TaxID=2690256 RepID=UPI00137152DA|nr:aromatic ring-opening dioxygenase LigA [Streptomyces sp. SID2888]MYV44960.1 aromatic ring-opening dioxygenase LigA [Streptomyces sp. SID2888]
MTSVLDRVRRLLDAPPPEQIPGQAALDVPTEEKPGCDTGRPLCGAPARFTAAGWRCDDHRPRSIRPT